MRKFIGKTEIEILITGILQISPNFGLEALRYNIFTYIKCLFGFLSERFRMSRPTSGCLFTLLSCIDHVKMSALRYLIFSWQSLI